MVELSGTGLAVGALLNQKYQLLRLLGAGAAGSVWEAENTLVGKRVALKILHPEFAYHPEIRGRFIAEARASVRIASDHVVEVFDLGETVERVPFMVMELCEGETLSSIIESRGAVGVSYACELMLQVCRGLQAAHALGIVHRDLKPANVIVVHPRPTQPLAKVLDFGIAKGVHPDGQDPEEQGLFGTPHYMAPEQAAGDLVDHRADIYAAGAILYELLAGRPPFVGSLSIVFADLLTRPPKPLTRYAPGVPRDLEVLVHQTLAKDPGDRPQSASALQKALSAYVQPEEPEPLSRRESFHTLPPLPLISRTSITQLSELVADETPPSSERAPLSDLESPKQSKPRLKLQLVSDSSLPPPPGVPRSGFSASSGKQAPPLPSPRKPRP